MKSLFKLLTFIISLMLWSQVVYSQSLVQDSKKTFLRWDLSSKKEQVKIEKRGSKVLIQTLDSEFFEKFSENIAKLKKDTTYHAEYKFKEATNSGSPFQFEIDLSNSAIELFSFYKEETQSYVLDFWINQDLINSKVSSASTPKKENLKLAKLPQKRNRKVPTVNAGKTASELFNTDKISKSQVLSTESSDIDMTVNGYRDFRYGAAFVWDYKALIPPLEEDIDLAIKAPDFLYEIKDRTFLDDKKEAHVQLNINFYRKEQWGLMTRSIELYESKYGKDKYADINSFMKATSLIKNNLKQKIKPEFLSKVGADGEILSANDYSKKGIMAAARNILSDVVDLTKDTKLKKSTLRYLIQQARNDKDYIQALNYAKALYVTAAEDFDDDLIILSSRVILNSLANLKQLDKIKLFLDNKAVMRVLPKQEGLAYIGHINLSQGNTNQVITDFARVESSLTKPYHPSLLFNTAEAYFRQAKYEKAISLYDEFINNYSRFTRAADARLRIALGYDFLGRDVKKVMQLYKDAINKSADAEVRFEAKLRYVGLRSCRKEVLDEEDKEVIVFINGDAVEKKRMTPELRKLLWLVRLRTYINTQQYDKALTYLTSVPVEQLRRIEQRTFNADGAEIILGLIQDSYLNGEYGRTVKVWETYKDKYEHKVARNPYMSFIVSDSFIKLGLLNSYERSMKDFVGLNKMNKRYYPLWVKSHKDISINDYIVELQISKSLKQNDYKLLEKLLQENKDNKNINYKYYSSLVSYKLKKYNDTVASIESILVAPSKNNILTPDQNLKMLRTYLESLYEVAASTRFRQNSAALINDLRRTKGKRYASLIERADYLYIESLFSEKKVDFSLLKSKTEEFVFENKGSIYRDRISYLNGISLIKNDQKEEGTKVLESLISGKDVPDYIKGLARTELSSLKLENKTL